MEEEAKAAAARISSAALSVTSVTQKVCSKSQGESTWELSNVSWTYRFPSKSKGQAMHSITREPRPNMLSFELGHLPNELSIDMSGHKLVDDIWLRSVDRATRGRWKNSPFTHFCKTLKLTHSTPCLQGHFILIRCRMYSTPPLPYTLSSIPYS